MPHDLLVEDGDLQRIGYGVIREFIGNGLQFFLYGVYILLVYMSLSVLLRQRRPTSWWLITTVLCMFVMSTFLWISTTAMLILRVRITLIDSTIRSMDERLQLANGNTSKFNFAQNMVFLFNCLVGDAMLTWRVCTLCQNMRRVVLLLGTVLLGMLAITIGYLACSTTAGITTTPTIQAPHCSNLWFSGLVLSAVLNTIATALLARLAWRHRQLKSQSKLRKTQIDRVLTIFVICGLVYLVFFIAGNLAPYYLTPTPVSLGLGTVASEAFNQLTGIYPNAVTVLATHHEVVFGAMSNETERDIALHQFSSIRFRRPTVTDEHRDHISTDGEDLKFPTHPHSLVPDTFV